MRFLVDLIPPGAESISRSSLNSDVQPFQNTMVPMTVLLRGPLPP